MKTCWTILTAVTASVSIAPCSADAAVTPWNATIAASNPLDWYQFNELSGSALIDYGSAHLNGTYGTGPTSATLGVPGILGAAAQFGDQSTAIMNGPDVTGNWSAEFVLKRIGTKISSVLIRGTPFAFPTTALKLEQYPGTEQVGFTQYGVVDYTFSPAVPTPFGQWMDLVYVNRAGSGLSSFLDGQLVGTNPNSIDLDRYQIGSNADTVPESPLAIMNAAVLYNRALSPSEIAAHWAAVPEPSTWLLATFGAVGVWLMRRRRRKPLNRVLSRLRLVRPLRRRLNSSDLFTHFLKTVN
jgi:PEP-CTERM motif